MHFDIKSHTVYLVRHGSHAYGTNIEGSDLDLRGFAVAPRSHVQGFAYTFEQCESKLAENIIPQHLLSNIESTYGKQVDSVVYDIRKFCNLAADCNPNIIEVLFVDDSDILLCTKAGRLIRDNRNLFLSKRARRKFSGYAISQLKRIKTHRSYILNPPTHKPTREEFGLPTQQKITPDMMGAFDKLTAEGIDVAPNVMELVQREKRYKSAMDAWTSHEKWKATRNPARAELEEKYHYDSKHALHLVRLLLTCREILTEGVVRVKRPDADKLIAIRNGAWSYEQLIEWAEQQDAEMQELCETSSLPDAPDDNKLNELCIEAQELFWKEHGKSKSWYNRIKNYLIG